MNLLLFFTQGHMKNEWQPKGSHTHTFMSATKLLYPFHQTLFLSCFFTRGFELRMKSKILNATVTFQGTTHLCVSLKKRHLSASICNFLNHFASLCIFLNLCESPWISQNLCESPCNSTHLITFSYDQFIFYHNLIAHEFYPLFLGDALETATICHTNRFVVSYLIP